MPALTLRRGALQGGVNQLLDDDFVGKVELKESFNLGPQCQRKLLEACDYLEGFNRAGRERIEKLVKRSDNGFFQVLLIRPPVWNWTVFGNRCLGGVCFAGVWS